MPPRRNTNTVEKMIDELMTGDGDIKTMSKDPNATCVIMTILAELLKSDRENTGLRSRVEELEKKVDEQQEEINGFEEKMFRLEQYSSRSTAILTGIDKTAGEDVSVKVCTVLNEADPGSNITPLDLSNCHRNSSKADDEKPPTITVVFNRSQVKDQLMKKEISDILKKKGMRLLHHMGPTVRNTFNKLYELDDVKWVYYLGHSSNFSVKMHDENYYIKVKSVKHLLEKIEKKDFVKPKSNSKPK